MRAAACKKRKGLTFLLDNFQLFTWKVSIGPPLTSHLQHSVTKTQSWKSRPLALVFARRSWAVERLAAVVELVVGGDHLKRNDPNIARKSNYGLLNW